MRPYSFTDAAGTDWMIEINGATVKLIKQALDVNVLDLVDYSSGVYRRYMSDPIFLVNLICAACNRQLTEEKLSDEDFAARIDGEAIGTASVKLLEAVANFIPNLAARRVATLTLQKVREVEEKVADEAAAQIETRMKIATDEAISIALGSKFTEPFSNAAESSDSTQTA